jgi:polyisoprenyl-teichoic acid--peptidoglycan teichoic acid transferase
MQLTRTRFLINRLRRHFFSHVQVARIGAIVLSLSMVVGVVFFLRYPLGQITALVGQFTGSGLVEHLGSTNFLVMGMGGGDHEGADLTDTNIFVSANRFSKQLTLISIPRDVWVTSLRARINTAYHYGFLKSATAGGILLAKSAVSEIINQPVDYVVILDFSTFEKAINQIGGIDVTVDRSFTDKLYPVTGRENDSCAGDPEYLCRYETIQFVKGPTHLTGDMALKYVRSRHSDDEIEGTDFGRSKRQEKVMAAVATKLFSLSTLRHPSLYTNLLHLLTASAITDLTTPQYFDLASLLLTFRNTKPISTGLTEPDQLTNPPISPRYDNNWVLVPKDDNPQVIYDFVAKTLGTP